MIHRKGWKMIRQCCLLLVLLGGVGLSASAEPRFIELERVDAEGTVHLWDGGKAFVTTRSVLVGMDGNRISIEELRNEVSSGSAALLESVDVRGHLRIERLELIDKQ